MLYMDATSGARSIHVTPVGGGKQMCSQNFNFCTISMMTRRPISTPSSLKRDLNSELERERHATSGYNTVGVRQGRVV
jgi:hypothetical protein